MELELGVLVVRDAAGRTRAQRVAPGKRLLPSFTPKLTMEALASAPDHETWGSGIIQDKITLFSDFV
ncbi:MAG: hypothetical protein K6C33_06140 [Desulfovibrio sp.]|nr:hypothetical protein [Desulfovibrio sp.]MCR5170025.1 hypothetical protein [Desulfovibrio sp.]